MPLYRPRELLEFLESIGTSPKKGLSQNFLIDGNIIRKIVASADVTAGDLVIEIGPGPGALTEALLDAGARVLAIEKDQILGEALQRLQTADARLEVWIGDVMDFSFKEELAKRLEDGQRAKVVANLPYHLTTPIITGLVPLRSNLSDIVVMVQDEVALRLTAKAGGREYGSITLMMSYFTDPRYAFKVKRSCFFPPPKVDSAVVHFTLKEPPKVTDETAFFELTRGAFQQRRKMVRSTIGKLHGAEKVEAALVNAGYPATARPEVLGLEGFLALFEGLNS